MQERLGYKQFEGERLKNKSVQRQKLDWYLEIAGDHGAMQHSEHGTSHSCSELFGANFSDVRTELRSVIFDPDRGSGSSKTLASPWEGSPRISEYIEGTER
mmetsp:Transcript_73630/g.153610  ORF Transcript_73630/g.153610 Transcript_73630/m.153610 type:complete len:101 (-) Transcript_73630:268-570(-)